jgi:capsular polysaccharide biosynthesis protein
MASRVIEEPAGACIQTVESPGFQADPPFMVREELLPANWRRLLDAVWEQGWFPPRPVRFLRLRDVFVVFEGLVFDKYGDVYRASVTGHSPAEIEAAAAQLRDAQRRGAVAVELAPAVLLKKRGANNYGHYLIEMLPKAHLARTRLGLADLRYVVADEGGRLGASIADSCAMLGIAPDRLVRCGHGPVFFREVIVVDGLTEHGRYMSPLVMECADALAAGVPPEGAERIYVTRRSAAYRRLANEAALAPLLQRHGYATVDPGAISFRAQVAAFRAARRVIGVDGAGMTNIVFAPPGAVVTCLTPGTMPEAFYWFLCLHRGHAFRDVRLPEQGGEPPGFPPWCGDLAPEPEEFERWLKD